MMNALAQAEFPQSEGLTEATAAVSPPRTPISAAAALIAIIALLLLPVGAIVQQSIAGSPAATAFAMPADTVSDSVAATAAEFRVDESGAAAYAIPLFTAPGTAGVVPRLSLNYSSQGGAGPMGRGWSIGGVSSIARCRSTRESGDFVAGGVPVDGNPAPVNYSATDRYCLDGQRLVPGATGCAAVAGMAVEGFFTEVQTWQRICAYTPSAGTSGVAFFTVEGKDGSLSWYGDRDGAASANRPDGYVNSTAPGKETFALMWAQTRFQDSTGNYIDYLYAENPNGEIGEHLLSSVRYTGRIALPGQATPAQAPYAEVFFQYQTRAASAQSKGYVSGGLVTQAHRLIAVRSESDSVVLRHYALTYAASASGSGLDTLTSVQECRDATMAVCASPTTFVWSAGRYEFTTREYPANLPFGDIAKWKGFKQGDIDGDGRPDIVYIKEGSSGQPCPSEYIMTAFSVIDAAGRPSYALGPVQCTTPPGQPGISQRGDGGWHLFDYNGDGRDDLFISSPVGQGWRLFLSTGRGTPKVFDDSNNVIAGLSPAIPSIDSNEYQAMRADLNGDGLTDIVYHSNGIKARLMERQAAGFAFGAERQVVLQSTIPCSLCLARETKNWPDLGAMQVYDLNGDGASDLLMQTVLNRELLTGDGDFRNEWYLEAFRISQVSPTTITMSTHGYWLDRYYQRSRNVISSYDYIIAPKFSDINGDGLTDILLKETGGSWSYRVNTGLGFSAPVSLGAIAYDQHLQLVDVSGDGRADIVYPNTAYSGGAEIGKKFFARLAQPDGAIAASPVEIGGNAFLCEGYNCDPSIKLPIFSDFDADGNLDFMSLKLANNPDLFVSRAADRYIPRDVIVRFINGYGAETEVGYAPLSLKDLYRPDTGTRNSANWGRGSPVQDMLAPMYAVQRVSSSAAQNGDPSAKSTLHYRYNGAKMQAGGRGFLGFREILTIDPNQSGGYVTVATQYAQNFPFVGLPLQTSKFAAINMVYVPSSCLANPAPPENCFAPGNQPGTGPVGTAFAQSQQIWEGIAWGGGGFQPGVQTAILPFTAGTQDVAADPYTATQTSRVVTTSTHAGYGNIGQTSVDSYTGTATTPTSTLITQNSYGDDVARWRLGRLTGSTATHRRPGMPDVVRTMSFAYAMGGPVTGLLTEERVQPGGNVRQDLRKAYTLDDYGNRIASFVCSQQVADCRSTSLQYSLWDMERVHRYSRQEYDARGRYPTRTIELFRPAAAATVDTTQPAEVVTAEVLERDPFGNVTEAVNVNSVRSVARSGSLGRDYYAWQQTDPAGTVPNANGTTGVSTTTTYRWCNSGNGAVACPPRAKFRTKTTTTAASTHWVYYDLLGREVLKVAQTFNIGVSGKDTVGVCTEYDAVGRASRVSTPFFLAGTSASGEPSDIANVCDAGNRQWTVTQYDVLGRPVQVTEPNNAVTTVVYSGLTTTTTNARGHAKVEIRNGQGELVQATDAAGLTTNYIYEAAGNLQMVTRDAGRGGVATWIGYDALGRRTYINDPDSGERHFGYNAAGEMVSQYDAAGEGVEWRYDFRGRKTFTGSYYTEAGGTVWEHTSAIDLDTAVNGIGQEKCSSSAPYSYRQWVGQSGMTQQWSRCNTYDAMGRMNASTTSIDGVSYATAVVFDALGRTQRAQDPSGKWLKTEYGARGHALRLCESSANDVASGCAPGVATTYLENHETDSFGNMVRDTRGGSQNMQTFRSHDPLTGRLTEACAGSGTTNCAIMRDRYVWDGVGNLSWRDRRDYGEDFWYDAADRFEISRLNRAGSNTYAYGTGQVTDWNRYDRLGNVCAHLISGTTASAYSYAGRAGCGLDGVPGGVANASQTQSPHQVLQAGAYVYTYDGRGNQTFADAADNTRDRTIRYTSQDQAYEISKGSAAAPNRRARFWYDPAGNRYKREDTGVGITGTRRTLYVGNLEIVTENGTTTYKRYIGGVLVQSVVNGVAANRYLFTDHLGSPVAMTNENGVVLEGGGFNAFGERRVNGSATAITFEGGTITARGYTGHEMLDGLDVIHMNGRIYDPTLGRFLQVDPVVQDTANPQNWNGYTYVFNNPYTHTDLTGESALKRWWRPIVAIALSIVTYGAASTWASAWLASSVAAGTISAGTSAILAGAIGGAAAGFVGGAITTGTLKGALYGAFTGAVFGGIAGHYGHTWNWERVVVESLAGGVTSEVTGGSFADGFKMQFIASSLNYATTSMRKQMIEQSEKNPENIKGESAGYRGDGKKIAGVRYDVNGRVKSGPLGGVQGGEGRIFGMKYKPHSFVDRFLEAWAGPHDWFSSIFMYDPATGNNLVPGGIFSRAFRMFWTTISLPLSLPFVVAGEASYYMYQVGLHERGGRRR